MEKIKLPTMDEIGAKKDTFIDKLSGRKFCARIYLLLCNLKADHDYTTTSEICNELGIQQEGKVKQFLIDMVNENLIDVRERKFPGVRRKHIFILYEKTIKKEMVEAAAKCLRGNSSE